MTALMIPPLVLAISVATAGEKHDHEHRQHAAHVHGIAALTLALEGDEVHIELDSPAANIVGFEHAPSSEAEHAALARAVTKLEKGSRLFRFNSEAECRMEQARVDSALLKEMHDHEEHAHEHEEHGHKEHEHEEHAHEDHGHDGDEYEGDTHSDIRAVYHFECDQPDNLIQLTVELFEAFPATEEINVQYVIGSRQGASELTARKHVIKF